jgi:hypothetical protein
MAGPSPTQELENSTLYNQDFTANQTADVILGILYLFCLVFGVPRNLVAFSYFLRLSKDLSTCLYLVITGIDVMICMISSIIAFNMFDQRSPLLFDYSW